MYHFLMKPARSFPINYVFIDFENVQKNNLKLLSAEHFRVMLFIGAQQTKIDVVLADEMHRLGPDRSKFIRVSKIGKNALDFHITYYLGRFCEVNPHAVFHIISEDKGYDPLIDHLTERKVKVYRHDSITHIPILNVTKKPRTPNKKKFLMKS